MHQLYKKIVSQEFSDIPTGQEEAAIFPASNHFMLGYGKIQVHDNTKKVNLLKKRLFRHYFPSE